MTSRTITGPCDPSAQCSTWAEPLAGANASIVVGRYRAAHHPDQGGAMAEGRSRDVAAYSDLVTARSGSLFRTAYLMVGDHQLAQDLLQESLVKTYVAWPRLRDVTKAEAYTRRTIVTTAISWRRRRSFHERPVD